MKYYIWIFIIGVLSINLISQDKSKYSVALEQFYNNQKKEALESIYRVKTSTDKESYKNMILQTVILNSQGEYNPKFKLNNKFIKMDELYFVEFQNHMIKGNTIESLQSLKKIKEQTVHQFLTKRSKLFLAKFYFQRGNFNKVKEYANRLILQGGDDFLISEALKLLLELAIIERQSDKVLEVYGQLIQSYPEEDPHNKLWDRINTSFRKHLKIEDCFFDAHEHLTYLRSLFRQQFYEKALNQANYMIKTYLMFNQEDEVKFILAMTNFHLYRYEKSIALFKEILAKTTSNSRKAHSLLYLGLSLEYKHNYAEAEKIYLKLIKWHTRDQKIRTRSYYLLAKLYQRKHLTTKYNKIKDIFKKKYSGSPYYHQLIWEEDQAKALHYDTSIQLEQSLQHLIKNPTALKLIIQEYKEMEKYYQKVEANWVALSKTFVLSFNSIQHIKRYVTDPQPDRNDKNVFLVQVGLRDLLIQNLSYRLSQEVPLDYKAWLEKVHLMKDKEKTYEIVEELTNLKLLAEQSRQELPGYLVPYLYPIIYFDQLKKEAEKFELDPYLLLAIIREASQFSSYSRVSDRYGLFRLDPSVVKEYAFRLGHHWEGRSQLLNAKNNIKYGTFYFSELQQLFDGNIYLSLIALYRNVHVAKGYLIQNKLNTFEDLMQLKDKESSEFIKKVIDSYVTYRVLYHDKI